MKKWSREELDDLYDNYQYYLLNKSDAVNVFGTTWCGIKHKALRIGLYSNNRYKSNSNVLGDIKNYIDGLLLSDGSIIYRNSTSYYSQRCKYEEWLLNIASVFNRYGIDAVVNSIYCRDNYIINGCVMYDIHTRFYIEFSDIRYRWYKEWYPDSNDETSVVYKKIVPKDIELTPDCVSNWYLGDGSCTNYRGNYYDVRLATCGFKKEDSIFLSNLLNDTLGIRSYVDYENRIHMTRMDSILSFFDYISGCYVPFCYDYKFPKELIK